MQLTATKVPGRKAIVSTAMDLMWLLSRWAAFEMSTVKVVVFIVDSAISRLVLMSLRAM